MKCTRCDGLMVQDSFLDMLATERGFDAWRCISCGDIVDAVVLANRQKHLAEAVPHKAVRRIFPKAIEPAKAA